jgi:16S rRNA (cytidine1402-2'-O)-methyltransferase
MKGTGKAKPERAKRRETGMLYVVSTPIGNLEDITVRAVRVLKDVDVIAAENVAHTRKLCRHYDIHTVLKSYRRENQKVKTPEIIKKLRSGSDVAVVTDAGTPGISDPGVYLINRAAKEGIRVTPVPGPSAVIAALSVSGLATGPFVFHGFLPNKSGKRRSELLKLVDESRTLVFFEAPHRIKATLRDLRKVLGDREAVLLREMTKVFEEVVRGPVSHILEHLTEERIRGEFTLVLAGHRAEKALELDRAVLSGIDRLLAQEGLSLKDAAARIAQEEGLPYRQVYKACLARKEAARDTSAQREVVECFQIRNSLGLHARAAGKIVELGNRYTASLFLRKGDQEVDGGSILSILTLSCPRGTEIEARIAGEDAEAFMRELGELFRQRFGEGQ